MLKQMILNDIATKKLGVNGRWKQIDIGDFIFNLNPLQKKDFPMAMQELCDEGILEYHKCGIEVYYTVTQKGVEVIYHK